MPAWNVHKELELTELEAMTPDPQMIKNKLYKNNKAKFIAVPCNCEHEIWVTHVTH